MLAQMSRYTRGPCERCRKETTEYCADCHAWVCRRCQSTHVCNTDELDNIAERIYEDLLRDDEYLRSVARNMAILEMAERNFERA